MKVTIEVEQKLPDQITESLFGAKSHFGLETTVEVGDKTRRYRSLYDPSEAGELVAAVLKAYCANKNFEPDDVWVGDAVLAEFV